MITQSEMLAGAENPMSDPANNPLGNLDYRKHIDEQLMVNPLHLQNVLIAVAWMRANDVRPDDRFYNIDLDAVRWTELHQDPQFMQFMASERWTEHLEPPASGESPFAAIVEMKHACVRFRIVYGGAL